MSKILQEHEYPGLPKWPGVYVTGVPVTAQQAKDIIFRTDTSVVYPSEFFGGNDDRFKKRCAAMFGWQTMFEMERHYYRIKSGELRRTVAERFMPETLYVLRDEWAKEMQMVNTEYVYNSWLSSAYINGPTGWCHPDGTINVQGHNYGKWPGVEDIVADWEALGTAFPYLDLVCTLYSAEACEAHALPVCTIVVKGEHVHVEMPNMELHPKWKPDEPHEINLASIEAMMRGNYSSEQGWPSGWHEEFAAKSVAAMRKVSPAWLTDEKVEELRQFLALQPEELCSKDTGR
jgi:hypothetical protein